MVNSIKEKLNETDTISEIRLMLGHDKNNVCVVVEGESDQALFRALLSNKVILFQSYSSKIGVDNIVKKYFMRNKRVIGIRDKDYLKKPISSNCFFCDYSCVEMMILSIDSCSERLFCNFYKGSTFDKDTIKKYCLERLELLSRLRQLNELKKWKIHFDGIKPGRLHNINISVMEKSIVNEINLQNPSNIIDQKRKNLCAKYSKCTSIKDYLQITNGHDYINLFCEICKKHYKGVSITSIEQAFRTSFGPSEFKLTKLYNSLHEYQIKKHLSIVP